MQVSSDDFNCKSSFIFRKDFSAPFRYIFKELTLFKQLLLQTLKARFSLIFDTAVVKLRNKIECLNQDRFCLVCALFTTKDRREKLTDLFTVKYNSYFNVTLKKKWYVPDVMCAMCRRGLQEGKSVGKTQYSAL